jgi:hypothetical protein
MALTTDNLTTVEGLTPEQTAAIIALSEKDSELVAKKAAGEATSTAYGLVDEALKAVTGKEKPGGVFTTDHLKSTLSQLKSASESGNAKTLKAELDDVKAKYEALQKEKATPGDVARITELERDLKDATVKLENLQSKYTEDLEAWKTKNDEALKANENIRAAAVIDRDLEGFTYRDDIDESVVDIVRKAAREELMARPRKWVKGEDGKETLVFWMTTEWWLITPRRSPPQRLTSCLRKSSVASLSMARKLPEPEVERPTERLVVVVRTLAWKVSAAKKPEAGSWPTS